MASFKLIAHSAPSIKLHRGWLDPGRYVWSCFVTKLEARLRFGDVKYTAHSGTPRDAPKGKIPYIEMTESDDEKDSDHIVTIGDSNLITRSLVQAEVFKDLNHSLSPEQKALDMGIRALLEDKLYFYIMKERWIDNYYTMRDRALSSVPYPIRVLVGIIIYRKQVATLQGQGTGRYTDEELRQFQTEIWGTVSELLQASKAKAQAEGLRDEPFWLQGGKQPTEADTTLYGFIVSVLVSTAGPVSQDVMKQFPILLDYAGRIHDEYFSDYEKWETS